jgi:CMP-N-acetylneuraminic acid synthetase
MIMYQGKEVLCLILARGGSKGLPRKNVLLLGEKPLIAHSIDAAKKVNYIDRIYVSTEDNEIKNISRQFGAIVIDRPMELATDTADYLDTVKHMISVIPEMQKNPIVVLLETTLPLRKPSDVQKCIELFDESIDCVASINEVKSHPSFMYVEKNGILQSYLGIAPIKRRQLSEPIFAYNGSIFVATSNFIKNQNEVIMGGKMKGYLMDGKSSIDIDSRLDFEICKLLMETPELK